MRHNVSGNEAKTSARPAAPQGNGKTDFDVGRITVTCPKRGTLNVYRKPDGLMGAKVECIDCTDYGVSPKVRERFPEIGSYEGWAFADDRRNLVFRFTVAEASAEPERLYVIDTSAGRVYVPARRPGGTSFENGALVAFMWKYVRRNGKETPGREATKVEPLDVKQLSLIARLIANDKLLFPAHAEVLGVFLEGLAASGVSPQDTDQVNTALGKLAAAPGVPTHLQQLARVERTRLLSGEPEAVRVSMSQRQPAATVDGEPDRVADARSASAVATDVTQMKLLLS